VVGCGELADAVFQLGVHHHHDPVDKAEARPLIEKRHKPVAVVELARRLLVFQEVLFVIADFFGLYAPAHIRPEVIRQLSQVQARAFRASSANGACDIAVARPVVQQAHGSELVLACQSHPGVAWLGRRKNLFAQKLQIA
jgi:hypothetical protein